MLGVHSLITGEEILKLVMMGKAARICDVDRRTLLRRIEKGDLRPIDSLDGRMIFNLEDVEKLAKKIKADKAAKSKAA